MSLIRFLFFIGFGLLSHAVAAEAPRVQFTTTAGNIVLELEHSRAPLSVKNFIRYVEEGFYDGTIFHRVIEGFMVQGGGFTSAYSRKNPHDAIHNEANNGLRNSRYSISMARTNSPHSATSQFFINSEDNTSLDHTGPTPRGWGYAVFGRVVEGHDVVDHISQSPTGPGGPFSRDAPREQVIIEKAFLMQAISEAETDRNAPRDDPANTGSNQVNVLTVQ